MFRILYALFLFFSLPDIAWSEIIVCFKILWFSFVLPNTVENQKCIASLISQLGIIPIKLGQWMGYFLKIQYEHIPSMFLFLNSLEHLQNSCTYQKPSDLEEHFHRFQHIIHEYEPNPISSASIAQIYKGKTVDGRVLAIKIRHDGIEESINRWESIIQFILLHFGVSINFEQFFLNVRHQIDFQHEAKNLQHFSRLYRKNRLIRIPEYIGGDEHILIMEYVPSDNFQTVVSDMDIQEKEYFTTLSRILYEDTIFMKDVIHMDLHNGNWGVDRIQKQLVLYDFGWIMKDQSDFKRFFILVHLGRYNAMQFFLEKYNIYDKNEQVKKFVNDICNDRTIDTLYGIRLVLKMFPDEFMMDNFMFSVLSLCVFFSSLSEKMEDVDTYLEQQINFMESNEIFLPLSTLIKNLRVPETKEKIEAWCNDIKNSPSVIK